MNCTLPRKWMVAAALLLLASQVQAGDGQATKHASKWLLVENGAVARNGETGKDWSRCVEGMDWDGRRCSGTALLLEHSQAIARAVARSRQDGKSWRVPSVPELEAFAASARATSEIVLCPDAPQGWYWTSSTRVDTSDVNQYSYGNIMNGVNSQNVNRMDFLHGWAVDVDTGKVRGDVLKRTRLPVRLVRSDHH
ncbi:MAG: DUF1566 domain-containing protein [Burkholderiaceae bacterium]|nr:DUF1566 domain-containing protein [Roseateles sp.]MBV8471100.1 DUF1566 domain-containing protein [Burkholderiaceae bacterium]